MAPNILDYRVEPFSFTVGGDGADIRGYDSRAIQMACDLVASHGGGTVQLLSGTFNIYGPIRVRSNTRFVGEGDTTVLRKLAGFISPLATDAGYAELRVEVQDALGFKPGMGIQIYDRDTRQDWLTTTAVITFVSNNTIYFDCFLGFDYLIEKGACVSNACSLIEVVESHNIEMSNFVIEGNKEHKQSINGCRGGAIYIHKSRDCLVENVKVFNFNGDGISYQTTEHVTIRNTEVARCTNLGIHPGTGTLRTAVSDCYVHHNGSDGIYVCWRVQNGRFTRNQICKNGGSGISIGHKDTNNLVETNFIHANGFCGVYVRPESDRNAAHGNTYVGNTVEDNGDSERGYGFYFDSVVRDTVLRSNVIRDTGQKIQRVGIFIRNEAAQIDCRENQLTNHLDGDVLYHQIHTQKP